MSTVNQVTATALILCAIFDWYVAATVKRGAKFKFKVVLISILPVFLAVSYVLDYITIPHSYRMLLAITYILLLSILYWREVSKLTTKVGYYKAHLYQFIDTCPDFVWIKDTEDRFIYTNKAICDGLLLCDGEQAFGKTGIDIARYHRDRGLRYTFGEVCADSDRVVKETGRSGRFLEYGYVGDSFLALQVYKAPVYAESEDGELKFVGTVGIGRDMTYDFLDHERIRALCHSGESQAAMSALEEHINRFRVDEDTEKAIREEIRIGD